MMMTPLMQRIYEFLALVVALYFPIALLTWLVIDKLFATADGEGHVVRHQRGKGGRDNVFSDRSQPHA